MNLLPFYSAGNTPVHRLSAGSKLLILALAGTMLFFVQNLFLLAVASAVVGSLFVLAGINLGTVWRQFSPFIWLMVLVFVGHTLLTDWVAGLGAVLRLLALFLLAVLVTVTTPMMAMVDAISFVLSPLARIGLPVRSIGLMLSLTLRLIPLIFTLFTELRESRHARCANAGTLSLMVPLLVKSLQHADGLAEAIDARGFRPEQ